MESNKLAVLEKKLPLRAYPKDDLDTILNTSFKFWLSNILNLKADQEDKVNIAIPVIKEHCIGMGFIEIKKMFELYVDNKLHLKPIPNYFDRILLGKIVQAYRTQKPIKKMVIKEPEKTDDEKEFIMIEAVDRLTKEYKENKEISGAFTHVYEYLFKKGVLPKHTKEFKAEVFDKARKIAKAEAMTEAGADYNLHRQLKDIISSIESGKNERITPIAKKIILEQYFNDNI